MAKHLHVCIACGTTFYGRETAQTCSPKCRKRIERERKGDTDQQRATATARHRQAASAAPKFVTDDEAGLLDALNDDSSQQQPASAPPARVTYTSPEATAPATAHREQDLAREQARYDDLQRRYYLMKGDWGKGDWVKEVRARLSAAKGRLLHDEPYDAKIHLDRAEYQIAGQEEYLERQRQRRQAREAEQAQQASAPAVTDGNDQDGDDASAEQLSSAPAVTDDNDQDDNDPHELAQADDDNDPHELASSAASAPADDNPDLTHWLSYGQRLARRLRALRNDADSAKYGLLDDLDSISAKLNAVEFRTPHWEARLDDISNNLTAVEQRMILARMVEIGISPSTSPSTSAPAVTDGNDQDDNDQDDASAPAVTDEQLIQEQPTIAPLTVSQMTPAQINTALTGNRPKRLGTPPAVQEAPAPVTDDDDSPAAFARDTLARAQKALADDRKYKPYNVRAQAEAQNQISLAQGMPPGLMYDHARAALEALGVIVSAPARVTDDDDPHGDDPHGDDPHDDDPHDDDPHDPDETPARRTLTRIYQRLRSWDDFLWVDEIEQWVSRASDKFEIACALANGSEWRPVSLAAEEVLNLLDLAERTLIERVADDKPALEGQAERAMSSATSAPAVTDEQLIQEQPTSAPAVTDEQLIQGQPTSAPAVTDEELSQEQPTSAPPARVTDGKPRSAPKSSRPTSAPQLPVTDASVDDREQRAQHALALARQRREEERSAPVYQLPPSPLATRMCAKTTALLDAADQRAQHQRDRRLLSIARQRTQRAASAATNGDALDLLYTANRLLDAANRRFFAREKENA